MTACDEPVLISLVALEREAFGIDEVKDEAPDDAILKAMRAGRARAANHEGG